MKRNRRPIVPIIRVQENGRQPIKLARKPSPFSAQKSKKIKAVEGDQSAIDAMVAPLHPAGLRADEEYPGGLLPAGAGANTETREAAMAAFSKSWRRH